MTREYVDIPSQRHFTSAFYGPLNPPRPPLCPGAPLGAPPLPPRGAPPRFGPPTCVASHQHDPTMRL